MKIVPKLLQGAKALLEEKPIAEVVTNPLKSSALINFHRVEHSATELANAGIRKYRVKPDITIPVNVETRALNRPAFEVTADAIRSGDIVHQAEIGNIALRLSEGYEKALPSAKAQLDKVFSGFKMEVRSKGANSVYSKVCKWMKKLNQNVSTDKQAGEYIQDAIGGRIQLPNLTKKDVVDAIENFSFEGKALTKSEQSIIKKFFNNEALTPTEQVVADKYSHAIKCALAEKQSDPVVNKFLLSGMKDALDRKVTTIEKLEKSGMRKDLIAELKNNPNIEPLRLGDVNNYKGKNGIAYFSDNQIRQFERLQLATGEKFDIISCSENIDLAKYGLENLPKSAKDAIKSGGYTTGQINVIFKNGKYGEIQVRGTGEFAEAEHVKYDALQEKLTLTPASKEYVSALKGLKPSSAERYDQYGSNVYDFDRNVELGIKSNAPELPKGFKSILSRDSMQKIHEADVVDQKAKMVNFVPHLEPLNMAYVG